MRLVIELGGAPSQELYLSPAMALLQLDNVLNRHIARGHIVTQADDSYELDKHYTVATPDGTIDYRLQS